MAELCQQMDELGAHGFLFTWEGMVPFYRKFDFSGLSVIEYEDEGIIVMVRDPQPIKVSVPYRRLLPRGYTISQKGQISPLEAATARRDDQKTDKDRLRFLAKAVGAELMIPRDAIVDDGIDTLTFANGCKYVVPPRSARRWEDVPAANEERVIYDYGDHRDGVGGDNGNDGVDGDLTELVAKGGRGNKKRKGRGRKKRRH